MSRTTGIDYVLHTATVPGVCTQQVLDLTKPDFHVVRPSPPANMSRRFSDWSNHVGLRTIHLRRVYSGQSESFFRILRSLISILFTSAIIPWC